MKKFLQLLKKNKLIDLLLKRRQLIRRIFKKWWFDYPLRRRLLAAYLADYNKN